MPGSDYVDCIYDICNHTSTCHIPPIMLHSLQPPLQRLAGWRAPLRRWQSPPRRASSCRLLLNVSSPPSHSPCSSLNPPALALETISHET